MNTKPINKQCKPLLEWIVGVAPGYADTAWDATRSATTLPYESDDDSFWLKLSIAMQIQSIEEKQQEANTETTVIVTPSKRAVSRTLCQSVRNVLDVSFLIPTLDISKALRFKAGFDLAMLAFSSAQDPVTSVECLKALKSFSTDESFVNQLKAAIREIEVTNSSDVVFMLVDIAPYGALTYGFRRGLDFASNQYVSSVNEWLHSDADGLSKGEYLNRLWGA